MDNELFELCKEVYEKTGWRMPKSSRNRWLLDRGSYISQVKIEPKAPAEYSVAHLYTSDYLLEKLLPVSPSIQIYRRPSGLIDLMWLPNKPMYNDVVSDTPLKALLKLVIALYDAGVKL